MNDLQVQWWPTDKPIPYARNSRKIPERAIDKVASSIQEFGFRVPIVVDKDGVIICGHTRLLAAKKLGLRQVPVHVADNLTPAQVKAYRLMDNRSHEETDWDLDLLGPELEELAGLDFDLELTGFNPDEIDTLLADPDQDDRANAVPPVPDRPTSKPGDLWSCGEHRILCGDATAAADVARLLGERKPLLLVTDPPYGIELDSEWRDRAGLNGCGPAQASYMKRRTAGHTETKISGDTRADWSEAYELLPSLQVAYVWHASKFTREVLDGLLLFRGDKTAADAARLFEIHPSTVSRLLSRARVEEREQRISRSASKTNQIAQKRARNKRSRRAPNVYLERW